MIRRCHPKLSLSRPCRLLSLSRSSLYHRPKGESPQNLALMRRIDELFLNDPFYGSRQMVRHLWRDGVRAGRHRVRRLMRLQAVYQAPRTTTRHPRHRVYPYLLKGLAIERPDQVWAADITYIPVQSGFLYLVAIMDWATRRVLSWRLSNTVDARFCVETLADAMERFGRPQIFNTDQGSQFTSIEFTNMLKDAGVAISMDGRGRSWTTSSSSVSGDPSSTRPSTCMNSPHGFAAQRVIGTWMDFYNNIRPHSALAGATPTEAYENGGPLDQTDQPHGSPAPPPDQQEQQDMINTTGGMRINPEYTLFLPPPCPMNRDHLTFPDLPDSQFILPPHIAH